MSFDLAIMNTNAPISSEEASQIYVGLCEGNYDLLPQSDRVQAFYEELIAAYPDIDSCSDDEIDKCPWSAGIDISDGAVVMSMVWSRAEEVASFVMGWAEKHNLACYDPQADKVYLPPTMIG